MAARPPPVPAKDGVSLLGAGLWHVKSGDFFMNVPVKNAEIRLFYSKNDLLPRDQTALLQSAQILSGNPEMSKRLKISAEQTKQLNALFSRRGNGLELEPADREKLKSQQVSLSWHRRPIQWPDLRWRDHRHKGMGKPDTEWRTLGSVSHQPEP